MSRTRPSHATELIAYIDGASRGNPGLAAYGVVVETGQGTPLVELKKVLGRATNNVAEYQALLAALNYATSHGHPRLKVLSDSELLTRQINGSYKVKSPDLRPLYEHARRMIQCLETFSLQHIPREQNREADRLANEVLDEAEAGAGFPDPAPLPLSSKFLTTPATYQGGILRPHDELPLAEGEEVDLQIRRRKPRLL